LSLSDAFKEEIRQNILRRHHKNAAQPDAAEISAQVEQIFQEASPDIEVRVRMVNINYGHNSKMLSECKPLGEYAWFIEQTRKNLAASKTSGHQPPAEVSHAIDHAIDDMPEDFEIKQYITANRVEVKDMCLTEYNEAETMEMFKKEGLQEGWQKARLLDIKNLMDGTGWSAQEAMDMLKIPQEQRTVLSVDLSKKE
jgi:hypothetical protein